MRLIYVMSECLTLPVPLSLEMRLRQIGSRMMMTLKLMGNAGALAIAKAS